MGEHQLTVPQKRLRDRLKDKSNFVVIAELTCGPNFSFAPIDEFLRAYKAVKRSFMIDGFDFVGITSTDNSGGTPNIEAAEVLSHIKTKGLLSGLDFIPHISCKDKNADVLVSSLASFRAMDIEAVLVVTGDKPVKGKGVFELESTTLLQMITEMNSMAYLKASPDALDNVHQFFAGAAVSPFKYTEASQMQQYYKMEKKIACGAKFLITQVGWDWKKSVELFRYLEENNLDIPIIGNVFFLSTSTPAPRLMHDLKLPGCFVSDELFAKLSTESVDKHIERAAQQVAMYKSIGAAGVDIGSIHDFQVFVQVLERASEIGDDWGEYKDNLCWPKEGGFYLYDDTGKRVTYSKPKKKFKQKFFDFIHQNFLSPDRRAFHMAKKLMAAMGAQKTNGFVHETFNTLEYAVKHLLFDCEMCGDCYLPENFGLCTIGGCEKGLANAPCGDATGDGYCGNNLELTCIGEHIYNAAASETGGIEQWRATINKPRIHSLEQTSSILNYLFGKDHNAKAPLIVIGESIHASIPKTGLIMKQLHDLGAKAYLEPSGSLNYIKALIESHAANDAAYIGVNVDAFAQQDQQLAVDMIVEFVKLVRKWGKTVPVCIQSNHKQILIAGLKEWYNTNQLVKPPLLSSIKLETMKEILPLKKEYDYTFTSVLSNGIESVNQNIESSIDKLHTLAKRILNRAADKYSFEPKEIFFELSVCPLKMDLSTCNGKPGRTYLTFQTIKKIKHDPHMKDVHCLVRANDAVRNLPSRRIGIGRAYVGKAMEYGLDGAFVDIRHQYGLVAPDPELLELVDAYAKIDGSAERKEKVVMLIDEFCRKNKKPEAKPHRPDTTRARVLAVKRSLRDSNVLPEMPFKNRKIHS
jgi:methylenetetrahydrofolate reductase (NADPH)